MDLSKTLTPLRRVTRRAQHILAGAAGSRKTLLRPAGLLVGAALVLAIVVFALGNDAAGQPAGAAHSEPAGLARLWLVFATPTATATWTATPTGTPAPSATPTATWTPAPPTQTATPSPTLTPTATPTPEPTEPGPPAPTPTFPLPPELPTRPPSRRD